MAAATVLALALALASATPSSADNLYDQRDKVRKSISATKAAIKDGKKEVAQRTEVLQESEQKLSVAQDELTKAQSFLNNAEEKLAQVKRSLAAAKAKDAAIAKELKKAQDELAASIARVAQGETDLAQQQRLIGTVVSTAYQQQSGLVTFALLASSTSPREIADRVQWTDTIFDSTSSEMERLRELQVQLEQAKAARTDAEAKVAEQKRQTEAQVAAVKALADQARALADEAAERRADVAAKVSKVKGLVAESRELRDEAVDELEADKAQYDRLQAQEESISAKIKAQIAKDKASGKKTQVNSKGFMRPVDAKPGSPFGLRYHPILHYWRMHWGQDFGARCGAPLYAMADGKVTQILKTANSHGLGNWTVIDYGSYKGSNIRSGYAHQSKIIVKVGQHVKRGQVVGYVGTTGLSTGCHLHLQIYKNGVRVNPINYV
ncbi:MAG: peptidoglycan DD-metalloendopeptidase family protein [Propionicimonas sp.]|uniref:peptidoglycan DD-metalloendopeptidase family protein n=1 Tax=Propionicimonas sp. TaxID=1955623 RepID=UPI002B21094D|nr:peptidoglycan DD-metalloendopeptidase family protein [Propionicimonas sp.]MEA4944661.1 peptidoglycan DD-metalloendopeptidase family protein [Propionicimonas sp.]